MSAHLHSEQLPKFYTLPGGVPFLLCVAVTAGPTRLASSGNGDMYAFCSRFLTWPSTPIDFLWDARIYGVLLYHFELQMAGVILFSAMIAGGIVMWYRRRRQSAEDAKLDTGDDIQND